jgi:hypothetical protein
LKLYAGSIVTTCGSSRVVLVSAGSGVTMPNSPTTSKPSSEGSAGFSSTTTREATATSRGLSSML